MRPAVAMTCFLCMVRMGQVIAGDRLQVAEEGTLAGDWSLVPGTLVAPVLDGALPGNTQACIALGYRIGANGLTSGHEVLAQWSSAAEKGQPSRRVWATLAQASADAATQWRFEPRPGKGAVPTYTVSTFLFGVPRAQAADVRGHCAIRDLSGQLRMREMVRRRGVELFYGSTPQRQARQLLPESTVDMDTNRPVHRW